MRILAIIGKDPEELAYRVGYQGVTQIERRIDPTLTCYVYQVIKGGHLHSDVMGDALGEIIYFDDSPREGK